MKMGQDVNLQEATMSRILPELQNEPVSASPRAAIAARYPGWGARASRGSKAASIALFCVECMGGCAKDGRQCETRDCFLWQCRPSAWVKAQTKG